MLRDAIKHVEQGTRLSSGDVKGSRPCAAVLCSVLFCSGGPFWCHLSETFLLKLSPSFSKLIFVLTAGGGVKWEPLVITTLLKSSSYTRENERWKTW